MKRKKPYLLAGLVLLLFLLCTACGNTEGQIAPQDDPNEGLGGGLSEDTVNDFSGFEGIWLGEADNDYDSMEFDAEGNWTLYLSGEVVDDGYLRYEPEWEAIYAYSSSDDSGSLITMEEGQLYRPADGSQRVSAGGDRPVGKERAGGLHRPVDAVPAEPGISHMADHLAAGQTG